MDRLEIVDSLIDIHKRLFQHAIQNARGRTQIPLFSIQAPGHIGIDSIDIPRLNLEYDQIPEEIKSNLHTLIKSGKHSQDFPMMSSGLQPGLIDSFLNGFQNTHIRSVVSNPLNHYHAFMLNAEIHSKCIAEWLDTGTTSRFIEVVIQPEIRVGKHTCFGHWIHQQKTLPDLCVEGLMGYQSGQEAAERVFSSSFFVRDMKTMPASADEILAEVDALALSLWLSLGNIYRIQDIRFERNPWRFSPDENSPLGIKFQLLWDNTRENVQLQTFVRFNTHKHISAFDNLSDEFYERITKWMQILSSNRKAIFSFNMICEGFRDIARSVGEQSFRRSKIARDGLFKTISGLEGLNTDCKPMSPNGYKTRAAETFIDCWKVIWQKALAANPTNQFLAKAPDINIALRNIYALRSDLAHSDPTLMISSLTTAKTSCGELFNPGQYDASSVGISILMIIDELLEFFLTNDIALKEMLGGKKPT